MYTNNIIMRYHPRVISLFQALGIAAYVTLFATLITVAEQSAFFETFEPPMPFAPILFLLTFIISATICSLLMFGYPFYLFMHEQKREAITTVLWSVGWLILILLLVAGGTLLIAL